MWLLARNDTGLGSGPEVRTQVGRDALDEVDEPLLLGTAVGEGELQPRRRERRRTAVGLHLDRPPGARGGCPPRRAPRRASARPGRARSSAPAPGAVSWLSRPSTGASTLAERRARARHRRGLAEHEALLGERGREPEEPHARRGGAARTAPVVPSCTATRSVTSESMEIDPAEEVDAAEHDAGPAHGLARPRCTLRDAEVTLATLIAGLASMLGKVPIASTPMRACVLHRLVPDGRAFASSGPAG